MPSTPSSVAGHATMPIAIACTHAAYPSFPPQRAPVVVVLPHSRKLDPFKLARLRRLVISSRKAVGKQALRSPICVAIILPPPTSYPTSYHLLHLAPPSGSPRHAAGMRRGVWLHSRYRAASRPPGAGKLTVPCAHIATLADRLSRRWHYMIVRPYLDSPPTTHRYPFVHPPSTAQHPPPTPLATCHPPATIHRQPATTH